MREKSVRIWPLVISFLAGVALAAAAAVLWAGRQQPAPQQEQPVQQEQPILQEQPVQQEGWTAISMARDWQTIYGDGVRKTELPGVEEALPLAA